MAKRGRKPLAEDEKQDQRISIRFKPADMERLVEEAKAEGLRLSTYLRNRILDAGATAPPKAGGSL